MRYPRALEATAIASAGVALVLAGAVTWLLNKPPTADCHAQGSATHQVHTILAARVVVRPWLGQHHVYGVFVVPDQFRHDGRYAMTLSISGVDRLFTLRERSCRVCMNDPATEPGHYVLRTYVHTRLALWFLVRGLFGDLRRPCNWTLAFIERAS